MHDETLQPGDTVTIRKGAPMTPGDKRLARDCRAKVVSVDGRRVKVSTEKSMVENDDGSVLRAPFATFDLSYVYRSDT